MSLNLIQTCPACPEQYDVVADNGEAVGYLRLRHGIFTAQVPDPSGPVVYIAHTTGDGIFTEEERDRELAAALAAIEGAL